MNGLQAPAGTPPEVVAILADAIKKVQADPEHQEKMTTLGFTLIYFGPEEYARIWDEVETQIVLRCRRSRWPSGTGREDASGLFLSRPHLPGV
jgi:hypothetical protein